MPHHAAWLVLALVLAGAELLTAGFMLAFFALGALAAAAVAAVHPHLPSELAAFAVISVASMAAGRRALRRRLEAGPSRPSGPDAWVGLRGVVVQPVDPLQPGQVRVEGQVWRARAARPLPSGTRVRVVRVEGASLVVAPEEEGGP